MMAVFDIGGWMWQDIDDVKMLARAEKLVGKHVH
jgi:hypothetical protein